MAQLALPYYPSRSKEYQRIWASIHSNKPKRFFRTDDDIQQYQKEYARRPEVKVRNRRSKARLAIINLLGGQCIKCGVRDLRCLQIDHINGGGKKDNSARRTTTYYKRLLGDPVQTNLKFQILCANCNWIKRYENHESPHTFPYRVN